jgi:hypothetical protein
MGMIHHKDIEVDKTSHRSGADKKGVSMKPPRSDVALADRGEGLPAVQGLGGLRGDDIHGIAAGGTWGTAQPLPYADTIQHSSVTESREFLTLLQRDPERGELGALPERRAVS